MAPREQLIAAGATSFLLVEGGDEQRICRALLGEGRWRQLVCWNARGREGLVRVAQTARLNPNFASVERVGVVFDVEEDPEGSLALATRLATVFDAPSTPSHGEFIGDARQRFGVFIAPDGKTRGSIEVLCREAAVNTAVGTCVDAFEACAGTSYSTVARGEKAWLNAYLSRMSDPGLRLEQAIEIPGWFDVNHVGFAKLRAFLATLIGE